jgi:hypothetical protein
MDKKLKRSYNKYLKQYRFQQSNIDKENWHRIFHDEKSAKSLYELKFCGSMKVRAYPYKFYFLRSFFWFLELLIYINPIYKLDKQSKRHITIVAIMILAFLLALYVAYKEGVFDDLFNIVTA